MEATAEVAVTVEGVTVASAKVMEGVMASSAKVTEVTAPEASITIIITAHLASLTPLDTEVSGGSASGVLVIIGMVSIFIQAVACWHWSSSRS